MTVVSLPAEQPRGDGATTTSAGTSWQGVGWSRVRVADGVEARTLRELVDGRARLDALGVDEAWGLAPATGRRTVVAGIERRPPWGPSLVRATTTERERDRCFEDAVGRIAANAPEAALALGGGLDAAAVLLAWREQTGAWPTVLTLRTGDRDYDEVDAAGSLCDELGAPLEVIDVSVAELQGLLASAAIAAQCPLYDLHPVGRLALATAARDRGHTTLVTGDGADAAFRSQPDYDYVPVVAALTEAAGLRLRSPFGDDALLGAVLGAGPDPHKTWLRGYLRRRGAPSGLVSRPKRPRGLGAGGLRPSPERLPSLAARLGRPLRLRTERERISWGTLDLVVRWLEPEDPT
ncbi:MAG: asparagine synthase-related protein [Nannocystaceae bacterium]